MAGAQQMVDVDEGLLAQLADRLAGDAEHLLIAEHPHGNALRAELAVRRRIRAEREEFDMLIGHGIRLRSRGARLCPGKAGGAVAAS